MRKIARDLAIPFYQQIKDILRRNISSGRYKSNTPLPDQDALALELGVSPMTLRRAMIELTREGVLERIRGRGTFVRGASAPRSRKKQATGSVAIVMPYDQEQVRKTLFYSRILQSIHTAADPLGLPLIVRKAMQPFDGFVDVLRMDRSIRGVIIMGFADQELLQALTRLTVPAVLVDSVQPATGPAFDEVDHDDEAGAFHAVNALIDLGHTDIGLITAQPDSPYFNARRAGFERALSARGIIPRPECLLTLAYTSRAAYGAMHLFLQHERLPTAFFCTADELAVGAMAAIQETGRRIPQDISIVGFGDTVEFTAPALTTVKIPMEQMGQTAIRLLAERFEQPAAARQRNILPTEWMLRSSCDVPPVKPALMQQQSENQRRIRPGSRFYPREVSHYDPNGAARIMKQHISRAMIMSVLAALALGGLALRASEPEAGPGTVCHIKVLSDRVPDVSSLDAWKKSFIKDGMSDQEKALAVWKSVAAFQYQDAPAPVEYIHHEDGMYDPIKMFNVYGYGICCYAASHVEALGRYSGLNARGWGINNHSVCELSFDNAWHLIDASLVTYFPKEDGKLASVDEMTNGILEWYKQNPGYYNGKHGDDAMLRKFQRGDNDTAWNTKGPPVISRSPTYNAIGWWPAGTHGWYSTMQEYDGSGGGAGGKSFIYDYAASLGYELNIQLRKGEKLVRNWGNKGLHIQMDAGANAPECMKNVGFFTKAEAFMGKLDPSLKSYANGRVGNGTYEYDAPLASGAFKRGALLAENIASTGDDKAAPALHVADEAKPGVLIIRMPSSYVYLSGTANLKAVVGNGGELDVDISQNNGLDWTNLEKVTASGDVSLNLKDRVYRRYDYRLRFTFKGKGTGLDALKITHDIQHSQRALPALGEGDNKIAFSAGPQESTITVAANTQLDAHKGKQIEFTDYHASVQNAKDNGMKIEGGSEGIVTVPIETPGEMKRLKLWASYRTWGDADALEFRVSFDDGKTFKKVGDGPAQKFGRTAYCVVSDIPAGTKKALIQYVGLRKQYMAITAFRADADYADSSFGFKPVKITYEWEENGQPKKDEHVANDPADAYTIKCGPSPKMKSITLELAD